MHLIFPAVCVTVFEPHGWKAVLLFRSSLFTTINDYTWETMASAITVSIVDSPESVIAFLECLDDHPPPKSPILYCDLEGVRLSRHGSISILQIFYPHRDITFLIDIHTLGDVAFTTTNDAGSTLKSILELESITKVFFDVRNDSDALYAHFGIQLQGVHDLQLLEVATRSRCNRKILVGLATCIEYDSGLHQKAKKAWKATKQRGKTLFAPEHGGSYEVFNIRPMPEDIIDYCTQDVGYLPVLHNIYTKRLTEHWAERVLMESAKRVAMAQSAEYDPNGKNKASSPWPPQDAKKGRRGKYTPSAQRSFGKNIRSLTPKSRMNDLHTQQIVDPGFISPGMKVALRVMNKTTHSQNHMTEPTAKARSTPPTGTQTLEKVADIDNSAAASASSIINT
ncbi:MAG: hypothetical protein Q9224_007239 [Gallowayella concinna]